MTREGQVSVREFDWPVMRKENNSTLQFIGWSFHSALRQVNREITHPFATQWTTNSSKGQTPLLGHCCPILSSANMEIRQFTWEVSPTTILVTEKVTSTLEWLSVVLGRRR